MALRVGVALRRRWKAALVVVGIVAMVSGTVLTVAEGARRTGGAPDAYTSAVGGEVSANLTQNTGRPLSAEVAALPGVAAVESATFVFAAVEEDGALLEDTIAFAGARPLTTRLLKGRSADPAKPNEFVADRSFVAAHHAQVGDHLHVATWTAAQIEQSGPFGGAPEGPTLDAVLVGVVDAADVLNDDYHALYFSPAYLDDPTLGIAATVMSVRLSDDTPLSTLRQELDQLPDGAAFVVEPGRVVIGEVRNAVDAQAMGLWIMAAVTGLAAIVALGLLLSRHTRIAAVERDPLSALGYTSRQFRAERVGETALLAAVGVVLGAVLAVLVSGIFPTGFVRALEPHPGVRLDAGVLSIGSALLILGVLGWVAMADRLDRRTTRRPAASPAVEVLARKAPGGASAMGVRFALARPTRGASSNMSTIAALTVIVLGLVGALTFAASVQRLVSQPRRFGANFTFEVEDSGVGTDFRGLAGAPDVNGVTVYSAAQARAGDATVNLVGMTHLQGDLAPRLLSGRLPSGPDETAVGRVTARQLGLHAGDTLVLDGSAGSASYRVVGMAVLPTVGGNDGVGYGALLTAEGLTRLQQEPDAAYAAIRTRPGAPADAATRIAGLAGLEPAQAGEPASIVNVRRVERIPGLLAALLVTLAAVTLIHALVVSIQNRRSDMAVLKALGADGRWIARAVHSQATVLTVAPLIIGVPFGAITGSAVFRAFVDRIGALPDPALPIVLLAFGAIALVVVANVLALVPAGKARRTPAARLLRTE